MKVFIGLREIANYYTSLSQGFTELGIDHTFFQEKEHKFQYGDGRYNLFEHILQFLNHINVKSNNLMVLLFTRLIIEWVKILLLAYSLIKYDAFIFSFGRSFLKKNRDLPILKMFRKKTIFVFHGSDSRPPWMDGAFMSKRDGRTIQDCHRLSLEMKRSMQTIEKYADHIICNPASGQFFAKPFINWFCIGIPCTIIKSKISSQKTSTELKRHIRIVHSPSFPEAKGTPLIEQTIDQLNNEGYNIELITVTNQSNDVVIKKLQNADLVIDQMYSDTPLAGFALESVCHNVPVIVCGYFSEDYRLLTESYDIPRSEIAEPDNLRSEIISFINNPEYKRSEIVKLRTYLSTNWVKEIVARKFESLINEQNTLKWEFNPNHIEYFKGAVISEKRFIQINSAYLDQFGREGYRLFDKPRLLEAIVSYLQEKEKFNIN